MRGAGPARRQYGGAAAPATCTPQRQRQQQFRHPIKQHRRSVLPVLGSSHRYVVTAATGTPAAGGGAPDAELGRLPGIGTEAQSNELQDSQVAELTPTYAAEAQLDQLGAAHPDGKAGASPAAPPVEQPAGLSSRLDSEILLLALPTLATLAADPVAALVSTAWVGQLGATQLAGVGVAGSVYGAFTKLLNMPLLAIITSMTARATGEGGGERSEAVAGAVSSALVLALAVGGVQALMLTGASTGGLNLWGAGPASPLHGDAAAYLSVRAFSAPITVLLLALQGVFRGIGDTRAPLMATVASNVVNVALEPLFIFTLGWGVRGAAAAIATAQVVACTGLLYLLRQRVPLGNMGGGEAVAAAAQQLRPTGLLILRTLSVTATFALATALAARTDTAHAAAHQVAFQLWLASSLLADSLAVAAQSLVARCLAAGGDAGRADARAVARRVTSLSLGLGLALSAGLAAGATALPLPQLFSSDPGVAAALTVLLPAVVATQPLNALAFALDGVLYGVGGFGHAARAMAVAAAPAAGVMVVGWRAAGDAGLGADAQLLAIWAGLATLMAGRFLTIYLPLKGGRAPFEQLRE